MSQAREPVVSDGGEGSPVTSPAARLNTPQARAKARSTRLKNTAERRRVTEAELAAALDGERRQGKWTVACRLAFLDALAASGSIEAAARVVGRQPQGVYLIRRKDKTFAHAIEAAKATFDDATYSRAVDLALNGLDEEVTTKDGVRTTRKHSDKLLAQILAKHGVAKAHAKDAVETARTSGKAGEEARLWIEAKIAEIAAQLDEGGN